MPIVSPNAKKILVEKCLEDYFLFTADDRKRQSEIIKDCESHPTRVYIKTTLRAQRISIDFILVESYIQTLSDEFKDYLKYKYVKNLTIPQITQAMNCSDTMVYHFSNIITEDLSNLLLYEISDNMLFNEKLLMNLVNVFNRRIHVIEDNEEQCKEWLDMKWYNAIVKQRDRFEIILQYLQDCLRNHLGEKDIYYSIITAKSKNLQDTTSMLASRCKTSQSNVSRCLAKYKTVIFKVLNTLMNDIDDNVEPEEIIDDGVPELAMGG